MCFCTFEPIHYKMLHMMFSHTTMFFSSLKAAIDFHSLLHEMTISQRLALLS